MTFDGQGDLWTNNQLKDWKPSQFSIEWWLNPSSFNQWNQCISTKSSGWGGMLFHSGPDGVVYVGTDVETRIVCGSGTIELNKWQHFTFCYDNGNATFYKNGQLLGNTANMTLSEPWEGLHLGVSSLGLLHGQLKGLYIWDKALDVNEIQNHFTKGIQGNKTNLKFSPFDFQRKEGIDFKGKLPLSSFLPSVQNLLDEDIELNLSGVIKTDTDKNSPTNIHLQVSEITELNLGSSNPSLQLALHYDIEEEGYYKVSINMPFKNNSTEISVPLSAKFTDFNHTVYFEAKPHELNFKNLTQFANILNGFDPSSLLPPNCSFEKEGIALSELEAGINFNNKTLDYIGMELSINTLWKITDKLSAKLISSNLSIINPTDSESRRVQLGIHGSISFGSSSEFMMSVLMPEFILYGVMAENSKLNTKEFINYLLPTSLALPAIFPSSNLTEASIVLDLQNKSCSLDSMLEGSWAVIPDLFTLTQISTSIEIDMQNKQWPLNGSIYGNLHLAGIDIDLYAAIEEKNFLLKTVIPELPLSHLLKDLLQGVELPKELPDVVLSDISLEIMPLKEEFSIEATCEMLWEIAGQKLSSTISLALSRQDKAVQCHLSITAKDSIILADELTFEGISLEFTCNSQSKNWSVYGDISALCFAHHITLQASYEKNNHQQELTLSTQHQADKPLIVIDEIGSLDYQNIAITLVKDTLGAYNWDVNIQSEMKLTDVTQLNGNLNLYKHNEKIGLIFTPSDSYLKLCLLPQEGIIEKPINAIIGFDGITFNKLNKQWSFESKSHLLLEGLPPQINKVLNPSNAEQGLKLSTVFKANHKGIALTLQSPLHIEVPFPDIDLNGTTLSPGNGAIGISDINLSVGKNISLDIKASIALPERINYVFGLDEKKEPKFSLFKTYQEGKFKENAFEIGVNIGTAGVSANIYSSPFISDVFQITQEGDASYVTLDFQDFGALRFMLPTFSLDLQSGSLRAKGGMEVIRDLSLPLTPTKELLKSLNVNELSNLLPNELTLEDLKIYDEQKKEFKHDEFIKLIESVQPLPKSIKQVIRDIGQHAELLPDTFKPYLNIQIPKSLFFDIRLTPDASIKFDISVYDPNIPRSQQQDRQPIKALIPQATMGRPDLMLGVQLYGISFGELWSGTLLLAEVDVVIDHFNLVEMAASLVLTATGNQGQLASSQDLKCRYIIDKLFMPIIYQAGIPIPIPLFYNQLGVEYTSLAGGTVQTHIGFPIPKVNIMDVIKGTTKLKKFLTQPEYLLDSKDKPKGLDFKLDLSNNYIELPTFMGGDVLGMKGNLEFSAYEMAAESLNFCKKPSMNKLIKLLPLEHRIGSLGNQTLLEPITLPHVQWLVTTPSEFKQLGYEKLNLTQGESKELSKWLPQASASTANLIEPILNFNDENNSWTTQELAGWEPDSFTVEWWMKPTRLEAWSQVISAKKSTWGAMLFHTGPNGEVYIGTDVASRIHCPDSIVELDKWQHFAFTYEKGHAVFYKDAEIIASATEMKKPDTWDGFHIGAPWGKAHGQMKEVCVWDKALSKRTIQDNINKTTPTNATGLKLKVGANPLQQAPSPDTDEEGVVGLFKGSWNLDEMVKLKTFMALDISSTSGFNGVFTLSGYVAKILDTNINAQLSVNPQNDPLLQARGHCHLTLLEHPVLRGDLSLSDNHFKIDGRFQLFPDNAPINIKGDVLGSLTENEFKLYGHVAAELGNLNLTETYLVINNQEVLLQSKWLGQTLTLVVEKEGNLIKLCGTTNIEVMQLKIDTNLTMISNGSLSATGRMEPLYIGDVFSIQGLSGHSQPSIEFYLATEMINFDIHGQVKLLGITNSTSIQVRNNHFKCQLHGELFDLFTANIKLKGTSLTLDSELQAEVEILSAKSLEEAIKNNFLALNKKIDSEFETLQAKLAAERKAKNDALEKEKKRLELDADKQKKFVSMGIDAANQVLNQAKNDIERIEKDIKKIKQDFESGIIAVKQTAYNTAEWILNQKKSALNHLQTQISNQHTWYNNLDYWGKIGHAAGHGAKIATLESLKAAAFVDLTIAQEAFNLAKTALDGAFHELRKATDSLMGKKGIAQSALTQGNNMLSRAKDAYNNLPSWVINPDILLKEAEKFVSNVALDTASLSLKNFQNLNKGIKDISTLIGPVGLPIRLKHGYFSTNLSLLNHKTFTVDLTLEVLALNGNWYPKQETLEIDFNHLDKTAEKLIKNLVI